MGVDRGDEYTLLVAHLVGAQHVRAAARHERPICHLVEARGVERTDGHKHVASALVAPVGPAHLVTRLKGLQSNVRLVGQRTRRKRNMPCRDPQDNQGETGDETDGDSVAKADTAPPGLDRCRLRHRSGLGKLPRRRLARRRALQGEDVLQPLVEIGLAPRLLQRSQHLPGRLEPALGIDTETSHDRGGQPLRRRQRIGNGRRRGSRLCHRKLAVRIRRRANVERERHRARDHVSGARKRGDGADGADQSGTIGLAELLDRHDAFGGAGQRVTPHRHRHGSGVPGHAGEVRRQPRGT